MKVDAVPLPVVPQSLLRSGFSSGHTRIIVEVDHFGELRDYVILESTHQELVGELDKVIYKWDFHPPIKNGKRSTVVQEIVVNFEARGSVASLDLPTITSNFVRLSTNRGTSDYKIAVWQDLDSLPEPIQLVSPNVPDELLPAREGVRATFKFFIDQNGEVRLPHVSSLNGRIDDRVLVEVQEALRQWRFTRPTVDGKPVAVSMAQVFDFHKN